MKLDVLYEDNHLIAVFKPAGIPTQPDASGDVSLMDKVKKYLREKHKKPGKVFLGLLHRLDRPVSGIVLFAKTSKGASRLSEQFRNHKVEKIYDAIVIGKLKKNKGALVSYIGKDRNKKRAAISKKESSKKAELFYKALDSNNKYSLLEIRIKTGRFHQIRAQLSSIGHPILGDLKYGAPFALPDKSICLCATSLSFQLATKKTRKELRTPIPSGWGKYIKIKK